MFPQKHVFTLVKLKSQIHRSQTDVVVELFNEKTCKSPEIWQLWHIQKRINTHSKKCGIKEVKR